MSHGVHAVQHEVEHKIKHDDEHGGGHGHDDSKDLNKKVALLIAVLALFLAFSETLGKSAQTAALNSQIEASNLWNFFQAKNIRRTSTIVASEQSKLDLAGGGRSGAEGGDRKAGRRMDQDRGALPLGAGGRRRQGRRHRRAVAARPRRAAPSR